MNARALSAQELAIAPAFDHPMREHHETWLYYHLVQAANARSDMDRAGCWGDHEDARRVRENAIARASHHYKALIAMNPMLEPLLAQMALTEGLTP